MAESWEEAACKEAGRLSTTCSSRSKLATIYVAIHKRHAVQSSNTFEHYLIVITVVSKIAVYVRNDYFCGGQALVRG